MIKIVYACPTAGKSTAVRESKKKWPLRPSDWVLIDLDEQVVALGQREFGPGALDAECRARAGSFIEAAFENDGPNVRTIILTNLTGLVRFDLKYTRARADMTKKFHDRQSEKGAQVTTPDWLKRWQPQQDAALLRPDEYLTYDRLVADLQADDTRHNSQLRQERKRSC